MEVVLAQAHFSSFSPLVKSLICSFMKTVTVQAVSRDGPEKALPPGLQARVQSPPVSWLHLGRRFQ